MVRLFDLSEAQYYCKGFRGRHGTSLLSFRDLVKSLDSNGPHHFAEGQSPFDDYRDCSLRDAERRIFLAVSLYRRSLDLMHVSAAAWAHVTLYYSSFFAASAILQMFGCYVG